MVYQRKLRINIVYSLRIFNDSLLVLSVEGNKVIAIDFKSDTMHELSGRLKHIYKNLVSEFGYDKTKRKIY
jgi:predicted RNA-binding protein